MGFKTEKVKIHTGRGAIIGQFQMEGEQVKGDVASNLAEVVTAAERQASDLIHRDRIPRQYHKAIKEYFSSLQRSAGPAAGDTESDPAESSKATDDENENP